MLHKNKLTLFFPFNDISAFGNKDNVAALFSLTPKIQLGGFIAVVFDRIALCFLQLQGSSFLLLTALWPSRHRKCFVFFV